MPVCFSVYNVCGYNEKYNTILYREPILIDKDYDSKYILFFPGDYSNFFTNTIYTSFKLESNYECVDYCFSYEALFWVISHKYLCDHIIFIKPSTLCNYYATFSNFVNPSETSSNPVIRSVSEKNSQENNETTRNNNVPTNSIKHLLYLLISLNKKLSENKNKDINNNSSVDNWRININGNKKDRNKNNSNKRDNNINKNIIKEKMSTEENNINETYNKEYSNMYLKENLKKKLVLIGFSKGCTVLISLLREANKMDFFWSKVDSIFFLDPGFNKNTFNYTIENCSLENISEHNLKIFIHSSPRQVTDESGSNIHSGLSDFVKSLIKFNVCVSSYLHYTDIQKSINPLSLHFEVLVDFSDVLSEDFYSDSSFLNSSEKIKIKLCINRKRKENFLFENWRKNSLCIDKTS